MIILDQICPKRAFSVEMSVVEHHHWILHIRITLGNKFHVKLKILIFWIKFALKEYFRSKMEKVNITIAFCIFELVWVPNFNLQKQFWILESNLPKKCIFGRKQKNKHLDWIKHIWISQSTKFYFKQTVLDFGTKFTQKVYFRSKTEKVNITIAFCILFELV